MKNKYAFLILIGILLLTWEFGLQFADTIKQSLHETPWQAFIPTPSTIIKTVINQHHLLITESLYTIARALTGFFLALIVAFGIATTGFFFPLINKVGLPLMFATNSFPIVGFAPLFILLFGQGNSWGIITISAIIAYFPLYISLSTSFDSLNQELLDVMRSLRATKKDIYTKIALPSSLPALMVASQLAIPASVVGATMGEWLGSQHGLGRLVTIALYQLKPGLLYASLLIIVMISIIMLWLLKGIKKLLRII